MLLSHNIRVCDDGDDDDDEGGSASCTFHT